MDEDIYTKEFFERHLREYRADYARMARWLLINLDFQSVVDLGCGSGLMIAEMLGTGRHVLGMDGCENALGTPAGEQVRPFLRFADLRQPIVSPADLVICTEVAEHLAPEFADVLVDSIANSSRKWVYFTGATPGQGGDHHINEQPHQYWVEKLEKRGFELEAVATRALRLHLVAPDGSGLKAWWFRKNALIFRKVERSVRPSAVRPSDAPAASLLPDTSGLSSFPRESWLLLGARLKAIGVHSDGVRPYVARAARGGLAVVKWELRRRRDPASPAMRMFVFRDAVTDDEARAALGPDLPLERMLEIGLLRPLDDGKVVSAFSMQAVNAAGYELRVLSDELALGGDAVMGPSVATLTLAGFARPRVRTARALDVGCGAGTLAMAMAPMCERVVATDISTRALALAQVNAWMNGIENIDLRQGDLMAPAVGAFDLIVSQPPFVPWPVDIAPSLYLFGGPRGDELPLRLLGQIAPHLAPGGFGITMAGWPIVEGDPPLLPRLREAVGPSNVSMLVLFGEGTDVDDYCATYGAIHHRSASEARDRDVIRYRDHFEQQNIRKVVHAYAVMRRAAGDQAGWTSALQFGRTLEIPARRESIEDMFAEGDRELRRGEGAP
jgi:methylase of polypeptide subunit release factors